ncbi:3'-5' exonuclease [Aliiglaciecola lipolytica]|uniref:3'-5' exonuclease n=1 Tax=Aliiglaciecola lipolytica TaxID=477689 RepID=UPI001C0817AD|nr:3'-5' exonuclease domain-containing protein 2 [Aliiglaciecola lipolytica]
MDRPTKDEINQLPIFVGLPVDKVEVVTTDKRAKQVLQILEEHVALGFDTESKPVFVKGEVSDGPHLIQLSTLNNSYLFQTHFLDALTVILPILQNPEIKKVGFGLTVDRKLLRKKFAVELVNTEELSSSVMQHLNLKDKVGARLAVAMILHQKLSKSAQKSNWSNITLTTKQILYASNDAYASLCVYNRLQQH